MSDLYSFHILILHGRLLMCKMKCLGKLIHVTMETIRRIKLNLCAFVKPRVVYLERQHFVCDVFILVNVNAWMCVQIVFVNFVNSKKKTCQAYYSDVYFMVSLDTCVVMWVGNDISFEGNLCIQCIIQISCCGLNRILVREPLEWSTQVWPINKL